MPGTADSRTGRARDRVTRIRTLAEQVEARAREERGRHRTVDVLFVGIGREKEAYGWIMAGALAYRFFLVLLPLALVAIGGLGVLAHAESESAGNAASSLGVAGIVSSSIASAAESPARWYALVIGIPVLLWETRTLLRALISVHRHVWNDPGRAPRPTVSSTLQLLAVIIVLLALSAAASAARERSLAGGILVTIAEAIPYAALWLLISIRLPHRQAPWQALVPGALLFAAGLGLLHFLSAYVIAGQASSKQSTYGVLGLAAALFVGLYLLGRLIVGAAVLNTTIGAGRL